MAKDKESEAYLFATEMWHRRLLEYEVKTVTTRRFFSKHSRQKEEVAERIN